MSLIQLWGSPQPTHHKSGNLSTHQEYALYQMLKKKYEKP